MILAWKVDLTRHKLELRCNVSAIVGIKQIDLSQIYESAFKQQTQHDKNYVFIYKAETRGVQRRDLKYLLTWSSIALFV